MPGRRGGKPIQPRTIAMCKQFLSRTGAGEDGSKVVGDLASQFSILRPAVWKALRSGKAVPPYRPKGDSGPGRPLGGGQPGYTANRVARSANAEQQRAERERPPAEIRAAPAEPCGRCGVRADVGCRHRPAEGTPPPAIEDPQEKWDRRFKKAGVNFHLHRMTQNIPNAIAALGHRPLNEDADQS